MTAHLVNAEVHHQQIIENLMQFYMYDFSAFVDIDTQPNGCYAPYKQLDAYWTDTNRFPYLIQDAHRYIGFALVRFIVGADRGYFSMAEFFVMKKYRQSGVGKSAALQAFALHKGKWEVFQRKHNRPAQVFWQKVIHQYTGGQFTTSFEEEKYIQRFLSR